jgi:hypothetical protein
MEWWRITKEPFYPTLTTAQMMQKAPNLIIYFPHSIIDKNTGYFINLYERYSSTFNILNK